MTNREERIIRKWCKMRCPDGDIKRFTDVTIGYFKSILQIEQARMLKEFQLYISMVGDGTIKPSALEYDRTHAQ